MILRQGLTKLYSIYMTWRMRILGAKVGKRVIFKFPVELYNAHTYEIGDDTIIHQYSRLSSDGKGRIVIGKRCKIGRFAQIEGHNVYIGDDVIFGTGVHITGADHIFETIGVPISRQGTKHADISIGNECWLASEVSVLKGVSIGKGTVVGAKALVNKSLPDYAIAVGIPAKVIHLRTDADYYTNCKNKV